MDPVSPQQLFAIFDRLGIGWQLYHHRPIFTVAEGEDLKKSIPGLHCRNLFLRDRRKAMFLVVAANETKIDLRALQDRLGCDRLSFGSPERLWDMLGVRPGSVCPFAIINDRQAQVRIILDASMMQADHVAYHPLENTMSVVLTPDDLLKFIVEGAGHRPEIVELPAPETTLRKDATSC